MNSPLISIVTICFNSENTIERTLKSVLYQDFIDYEYIIIDGASNDNTLKIINKYIPLFNGRMKLISEPDKGIYDAFCKGCSVAIGKYVWIVNSDDFIEKGILSKLSKICYNCDSIIVGGLNWIGENGNVIRYSYFDNDRIDQAYKRNSMIPHPATIVPKWIYEKYGSYDFNFKIAGDMDWFHRVYSKLDVNFKTIDIPFTNMTMGGISTSNNHKKEFKDRWLFFRKKYSNKIQAIIKMSFWSLKYLKKIL